MRVTAGIHKLKGKENDGNILDGIEIGSKLYPAEYHVSNDVHGTLREVLI